MHPAQLGDTVEETVWLQIAREELARLFGEKAAPCDTTQLAAMPAATRLILTIFVDGLVRGSMPGRGRTRLDQVRDAVRRAALDTRNTGPLTAAELGRAALEIWMQIGASSLPPDTRMDPRALLLGIDGVELECDSATAYYKPSVALTRGF